MSARTRESVLPLQSSSSLILASISREGDSPLVVALLVVALFFILFAPHSAVFPSCEGTNHKSSALTGLGFELCRQTSIYPRQDLLQVCKELLPPVLGALVGLLLIQPKARLLHAQVCPRARRCESTSDHTLETIGRQRVRQRFVRLDCQDLTVDRAPVCAKIETVIHDRLEVVLHEPLLDQVWLRERAPELFRRIRYLPFDNDGERFGRGIAHWSILLSRSSSWSNRLCQKPAIWLVQSISGARAPSCAL